MSAAAGLGLLTLIAQVEIAGQTHVLLLDDCPDGLDGFYAPARNRIGLCRNNHSSDAALKSTLLHEAMHRLQHCRQPELAYQLDAAHRVNALEEEARELQRWGDKKPGAATDTSSSRGSWNPNGWGGGVTADWWTDSFYVQGLFGGNSFSGRQERKLNSGTASGDRNGNSWNAAVRLGAPIDAGSVYLEPQAQFSWTGATFDSFSESGVSRDQRLHFSSSNADLFGTELAIKIGVPLRSDERSLFLPSLRLGWIANWGQDNSNQTVRYIESGNSYSYGMSTENANGLLVEAGIDYTTFNFSDTSVGVFLRGGPVFWGSDLGTSWRAWGGLSLDF